MKINYVEIELFRDIKQMKYKNSFNYNFINLKLKRK